MTRTATSRPTPSKTLLSNLRAIGEPIHRAASRTAHPCSPVAGCVEKRWLLISARIYGCILPDEPGKKDRQERRPAVSTCASFCPARVPPWKASAGLYLFLAAPISFLRNREERPLAWALAATGGR